MAPRPAANTKSVAIGLGWTVPGSLDLDASAMIVGGYDESTGFREYIGCVMYSNTTFFNPNAPRVPFVKHSGDNTTGGWGEAQPKHAQLSCTIDANALALPSPALTLSL